MLQRYIHVHSWNATKLNLPYKKNLYQNQYTSQYFLKKKKKKSSKCIQDPASNAAKEDKGKPLKKSTFDLPQKIHTLQCKHL